jgi:hypothetical protein
MASVFTAVCLSQGVQSKNAAEGANWNIGLLRHNRCVDGLREPSHKFDVTALLAGFDESGGLKPTLDLAEGLRLKPPQPQPRPDEL